MKSETLIENIKSNPFVLAPMAGITDHAFRHFMRRRGCGIVISELVSAQGLQFESERTWKLMEFDDSQRPFGVQLFGETPEILAKAARQVQDYGADFVDLNFGCPVPKVVKKGAGAALLRDLPQIQKVFQTVRAAIDIPLTVKIRTGWDATNRNALEVSHIAYSEGLTWVAIHGRTRAQGYSGKADWDFIREVQNSSSIPILGNGDIHSGRQAMLRLQESGTRGVMIGRGALKNPWIFEECKRELSHSTDPSPAKHSWRELWNEWFFCFEKYAPERLLALQLKKFASWYSSGYSNAAQFRKSLFQIPTYTETKQSVEAFFSEIEDQAAQPQDTSNEDFLMGGHG